MSADKPSASSAYARLRELTRYDVLDELHPGLRPDIVAVLDEVAKLRDRKTELDVLVRAKSERLRMVAEQLGADERFLCENAGHIRQERDELRERLSKLELAQAARIPTAKECRIHLVSKGMPIGLAASAAKLTIEFIKGRT